MTPTWFRDGRKAKALQDALEAYESSSASQAELSEALTKAIGPEGERLLAISMSLREAAATSPAPSEAFSRAMEQRLRRETMRAPATQHVRTLRPVRRQRLGGSPILQIGPGFAMMSAAACIAIVAGMFFSASRSLPGDSLYSMKRGRENVGLVVWSGSSEARYRIDLADERLEEVEGLVNRAQAHGLGVPGSIVAAATVEGISDPDTVRLIEDTLAEAEAQINKAAEILITEGGDAEALDELVAVAKRGSSVATDVAEELPEPRKFPALDTAANLRVVQAEAEAARNEAAPTPPPCATPTPTPTIEPEPTSDESSAPPESAPPSPSVEPTPESEPSATPSATPCTTPTPTPTPTPTATPDASEPSPATTDEAGASSEPPPASEPGEPPAS